MSCEMDLVIVQGKTFTRVIRWESLPLVYKAIAGITNTAPVVVSVPGHGVPGGWRVAIVSVKGMEEINASNPPKEREFVKATVVTSDSLKLNTIDSSGYTTYSSGGYIQYYTPVYLDGLDARMQIKDRVGGAQLALLESPGAITIDSPAKTITMCLSATDTAAYTWKKGVYDFEMVSPSGDVTCLLSGKVTVTPEVTTAS